MVGRIDLHVFLMNMRDIILNQAEQIVHSLAINKDVAIKGDYDSIVVAGMGGSGHPGDLLNALGIVKRPLYVHRNYNLPLAYLGMMGFKKTLVIASSYSGNTEESLSAYCKAKDKNIPLIASAAGGTLKEWSERDQVPFCLIDYPNMQPRHALWAAFTGIYTALKNSGLTHDVTSDLKRVAKKIKKVTPKLEELGKIMAHAMKDKVPVYVSGDTLGFATKNFKIQTNENAKQPAFWNTIPELNHNEMVGFSTLKTMNNPNKFFALFIRDLKDHPRNIARMAVTSKLYRDWGVTVEEFTAEGETLLEKIIYTVTFGLWTTYYLALEYGIDPIPVAGVENFKAQLKEVAGKL